MALSSISSGSSSPIAQHDVMQGRPHIKSAPTPKEVVPSADEKRQSALHVVNRTLTQAYEKIAGRGVSPAAAYNDQEPMTAEKAAKNILGLIERCLKADAADGATQEQLKSRLDAGLEGFKKGFAEAEEKLKALNMLSPDVETDIGDTYKRVLNGIDELRSKFIKDADKPVAEKPAPATAPAVKVPREVNNIAIRDGLYEYAEARDFQFELTTKEGDKVSIRASSSMGVSVAAGRDSKGAYLDASQSSEEKFSFSVEGDLNENELKAINDLLGRVDKLAGQFYAGNLDEAFDKAVNLGYDEQQITEYSLNLSQVQIQQVEVAYGAFAPDGDSAPSLTHQLAPVGNFIKDVLAALDAGKLFDEPKNLLLDLSRKMADDVASDNKEPSALSTFLERILATDLPVKEKEVTSA